MSQTYDVLLNSEKEHKEAVYNTLDRMRTQAKAADSSAKSYVHSGSYDDQDAFMAYGSMSSAMKKRHEVESLVQRLYYKPYFSHVELKDPDEGESEHFYLSDSEALDHIIDIGNGGTLIPFKQDRELPFYNALFHLYQAKKAEDISYIGRGGVRYVYSPVLICDDEIQNRKLLDIVQLFAEQDEFWRNADELLEKKLRENRGDPALRNIIATLQQKQFRIIETDVRESFVVQGCAGSGKSQCLFHRLFFLRDVLTQDGWDHVLLLTPTQLFRNYSADLIRRYQLSDIRDCSLAELYKSLLELYDSRFKNRQYSFELSEEYLPDAYLQIVYRKDTIDFIDNEIDKAIRKYISSGCEAVGIDPSTVTTSSDIDRLIDRLDQEMEAYDARDEALKDDSEYLARRKEYEDNHQELLRQQRLLERWQNDVESINDSEKKIREAVTQLQEALDEKNEWVKQRELRVLDALEGMQSFHVTISDEPGISAPARYMKQLRQVTNLTSGPDYQADEEYLQFLDEYCMQAQQNVLELTNNQAPGSVFKRHKKRITELEERINEAKDVIEKRTKEEESLETWLREKGQKDNTDNQKVTLRRADMERAKYFLSRIESAVYEREVWNVLAVFKDQNGIQTLKIDELENGRKRETRILYKSDLLFYLKIYMKLHPKKELPRYSLLCIDEGQDLHPADYEMLKRLYPDAAVNVFGDTDQVLHSSCGIHDWKSESGIEQIFSLDRNYRNAPEIVAFCNEKFGCRMDYVGEPENDDNPMLIRSADDLYEASTTESITVIVKDREQFESFCAIVASSEQYSEIEFEFLDTNSITRQEKGKVPCYSIFAAKGLEFADVLVFSNGMTTNQKIVACTRATENLYYYE